MLAQDHWNEKKEMTQLKEAREEDIGALTIKMGVAKVAYMIKKMTLRMRRMEEIVAHMTKEVEEKVAYMMGKFGGYVFQ